MAKTPRLPKLTAAQAALYAQAAARASDAAWMARDLQTSHAAALCASNTAEVLRARLAGEMPVNAQITPEVAMNDADFWYTAMRHNNEAARKVAAQALQAAALEICYQ